MAPISLQDMAENHIDTDHHFSEDSHEPIAVVGLSLLFPQEATNPDAFWEMLQDKRCSMTEWPKDRVNIEAFYHPDGSRLDALQSRGGHFLTEPLGNFDAPFFSITSAEATAMDPQQRLLLETAYKALENAGIPMEKASGSQTSVYTGCFCDDYRAATFKDPDILPKYFATGAAPTMIAARLSWFFNFTGPCVNLDSACSSSMMALDLACQGLRNRESNMALVGGANVTIGLDASLPLSNMNFLSRDSRCFSFDHRANGYGRGEGFGVIVLKRLADALSDSDTIRAVIRSTASSQDGHTTGITQPSMAAQLKLIKDTYRKAGLSLQTTRYVEAHGTGTVIGDPIEALAVGTAFQDFRSAEQPLYIVLKDPAPIMIRSLHSVSRGAVKSNIGHLEGTSGIAGVIKTILVLEAAVIPPNANFESLNPAIDTESLMIRFPQHSTPWPSKGLRRASVMSNGFGGSNSHAILDDACNFLRIKGLTGNHCSVQDPPSIESIQRSWTRSCLPSLARRLPISSVYKNLDQPKPRLLVFSAADEDGPNRLGKAYGLHMSRIVSSMNHQEADTYLESVAYTLGARRSSLNWKSYIVAKSAADLAEECLKVSKSVRVGRSPKLGFVFTGQGASYAGMGQGLTTYPVFQNSLHRSQMYLNDFGCEWSLSEKLFKAQSNCNTADPTYSQPICTALQIALVDLLRRFNLTPTAVVGHSSGEIAAAYCAGHLSHQSAMKVAFFRGQCAMTLIATAKHSGAMMAVGLSEGAVKPYLKSFPDLVVGCVNSPKSVTLSGDVAQMDILKTRLDDDTVFSRRLHVNIAYHSPQMSEVAANYLMLLGDLEAGDCPCDSPVMISSVTGKPTSLIEVQRSTYWVENMVSQVRFSAALEQICPVTKKLLAKKLTPTAPPVTDLLEVGPHSALRGPINDILSSASGASINYSSILQRSDPAMEALLAAVGRLYCFGYSVDLNEVNELDSQSKAAQIALPSLPEYPFDHTREYWHESRLVKEGLRLRKYPRLDLLGSPSPDWNPQEARWRKFIRILEMPWVEDHQVNDTIVYPAAGMLVMAIEASRLMAEHGQTISAYVLKDVTFSSPLTISSDPIGTEVQLHLRPSKEFSGKGLLVSEFSISANKGNHWDEICKGTVQIEYKSPETEVDAEKETKARLDHYCKRYEEATQSCVKTVDDKKMYEYLQSMGLAYGPAFQSLQALSYTDDGTATGKIRVFQWSAQDNANHHQAHVIHPVTLDAFFQLSLVGISRGTEKEIPTIMPTRIGKLWIKGAGVSYPSTGEINAHARAAFTGRRKAKGGMFALDNATKDLLLTLEQMEVTAVTTREARSLTRTAKKKICYNFDWKPDLDLLSNGQVLEYCERTRPYRPSSVDYYEDIGFILMKFMFDALNALTEGDMCTSRLHLSQYIKWARHQLDRFQAGVLANLSNNHPKWQSLMRNTKFTEKLIDQVGSTNQGSFYVKVGRNLLDILKGNVDPLTVMFQDDSIPKFYKEINDSVICYEPFNRWLGTICHKSPGLKILEIGAGTGATTDYVLDALSFHEEDNVSMLDCSQYVYTDISGAFFDSAANRYSEYRDKMRFKLLDVEVDPSMQGFELGTYDLIIAASVLHATKNLENTMRNARALLKPGGKLVLFEVTQDVVRARFAFGLLPGWWLSEEEYRALGPCISSEEWDRLLRGTGYSGADIEFPDYLDERCHEYSIIISTAVEETPLTASRPVSEDILLDRLHFRHTSIITNQHSTMQQIMASRLKEVFLSHGKVCEILTLEEVSKSGHLGDTFCLLLVELDQPLLSNLDENSLTALKAIVSKVPGLLWVTSGGGRLHDNPQLHLVDGFARVSRTEFNKLMFVTLALECDASHSEILMDKSFHHIHSVLKEMLSRSTDDFEPEYIENHGRLEIGRVTEAININRDIHAMTQSHQHKTQEFGCGPPLALHIQSPGSLDSLQLMEYAPLEILGFGEFEIKVESTGVNFLDCLTALGRIDDTSLGCECAGIVTRVGIDADFVPGDRVVSLGRNTYSTYTQSSSLCAAKIPCSLSFAEASALPVVFCTAWIALCDTARLQKGESILIHAGAGGTGQAAIQVAKYLGANIYVTVGSDSKKKLLMDLYDIPEDHIFYSRDLSFAQGIMRVTQDRGVDVILNSLSGNGLRASWECIAPLGRFVEIGKRDIQAHGNLPMWQFHKNVAFSSVDLLTFVEERPSIIHKVLRIIINLVEEKKFHVPQPFQTFGISEAEDVFRLFQSGKNSGKMAIEMRAQDVVPAVLRTKPDYQFDPESSYLIAGGLGGLGRSTARWMAERGARHLILVSRTGSKSEAANRLVEYLASSGVQVCAPACNINDADALAAVLESCSKTMPRVRGVIQASMVLKDAILENMTIEDWRSSIEPKVRGSWNLHKLLPQGLDFFICLSSLAGIVGSGGQANYAAGNTYIDALVRYRVASGQKATSLDLGWMETEGVVAESSALSTSIAEAGHMIPISQAEFHALLDYYCNPGLALGPAASCQLVTGPATPAKMLDKGIREPHWMQRRTFRHLRQIALGGPSLAQRGNAMDYRALMRDATSLEDIKQIVMRGLLQKLSRALSIVPEEIDVSKALHAYGVDSLLAVELRNFFAKELDADVAIFEIMGGASFENVSMTVAKKSQFCPASWRTGEEASA